MPRGPIPTEMPILSPEGSQGARLTDSYSIKILAFQAQKKVLSKVASKVMVVLFLENTSRKILDELYQVSKKFTQSFKEAKRVVENLV